jgi:hypothetical protein
MARNLSTETPEERGERREGEGWGGGRGRVRERVREREREEERGHYTCILIFEVRKVFVNSSCAFMPTQQWKKEVVKQGGSGLLFPRTPHHVSYLAVNVGD